MMSKSFFITSLTTLLLSSYPPTSVSFILHQPYRTAITSPTATIQQQLPQKTTTTTILFGKIKKGLLRNIDVDDDSITTRPRKQSRKESKPQSSSSRRRSGGGDDTSSNVSPALARWAATGNTSSTDDDKSDEPTTTTSSDDSSSSSTKKSQTKSKTNERRQRQRQRQNDDAQIKTQLLSLLSTLDDDIRGTSSNDKKKTTNVPALLSTLSHIVALSSDQLFPPRLVTSSSTPRSYRLAWVGSDDAICHVGTGLHKVPLARLQEVFVTFEGGRMELCEVIRILGPFPNVKNVLMGRVTSLVKTGGFQVMQVTYESMIDGTGKEILAGVEGNVRTVTLDLLFASEDVMICRVPKDDDGERRRTSLWEEDGSDVLLFLKEEDLDEQLEILRVA